MSVWYSPKLNGVAERTIRVHINAGCGLRSPQIPVGRSVQRGDDVDNRTPTKALGGRTPFEVLYGAKSDVSHLRAFGTPCAIVEPTERLRKLDNRATMCFIVGYKYATGFGTQKGELSSSSEISSSLRMACRRPHSTVRVRSPPTRTSQPHNLHLTTPPNRRRGQLRQMHPRRPYCSRPHWGQCTTMDRQRHLICASQYIY